MKRMKILVSVLLCAVLLSACGGNTANAWREGMTLSDVYTEAEINDAMDTVEAYFRAEFAGCELMNLRYDESALDLMEQSYMAERYGADEAIVLLTDFSTSRWVWEDGLQPDDCYIDWKWVLTRDGDGQWQIQASRQNEVYNP